jgi:hypothetical protein
MIHYRRELALGSHSSPLDLSRQLDIREGAQLGAQLVESLLHRRRLGDRMAGTGGGQCSTYFLRRPAAGEKGPPEGDPLRSLRKLGDGYASRSTSIAMPIPPATHIDSMP